MGTDRLFKPQSIPIWSPAYFRFWVVKTMMRTTPVLAFAGTPIYSAYLRLMGAKIGRNAMISCRHSPICADMLSIGDNTILRKDTILLCYRAQSNFIHIGKVDIGSNAFVGEASVIDIDTAMGDNTQLGHASSLQSGQRILDGKRYHGSPAIETACDYRQIEGKDFGAFRSALYTLFEFAVLVLVAVRFRSSPIIFGNSIRPPATSAWALASQPCICSAFRPRVLWRDGRFSHRDLCHSTFVYVVLNAWRHLSDVRLPLPDAEHHPARQQL